MKSWLWPDRTIGKRESSKLREEHNALVNQHTAALNLLVAFCNVINMADCEHPEFADSGADVVEQLNQLQEPVRKLLRGAK